MNGHAAAGAGAPVAGYSSGVLDWDMAELDAILSSSPDLSPTHVSPPAERLPEEAEGSDDLDLSPIEDREGKSYTALSTFSYLKCEWNSVMMNFLHLSKSLK